MPTLEEMMKYSPSAEYNAGIDQAVNRNKVLQDMYTAQGTESRANEMHPLEMQAKQASMQQNEAMNRYYDAMTRNQNLDANLQEQMMTTPGYARTKAMGEMGVAQKQSSEGQLAQAGLSFDMYKKIHSTMVDTQYMQIQQAYNLISSGISPTQAAQQIIAGLPQDHPQAKEFSQRAMQIAAKYERNPQGALQELSKLGEGLAKQRVLSDPEYWKQYMLAKQQYDALLKREQVQAGANAQRPTDFQAIAAAVRQQNPNMGPQQVMEEASRIYSGRTAAGQGNEQTYLVPDGRGGFMPIGVKDTVPGNKPAPSPQNPGVIKLQ